jgi:hypothetical protein
VDEGLLTPGASGRAAVYFHLQNLYSVKKDVSSKSDALDAGLRRIFGVGAEVVEKAIVRNLYCKLGVTYEEPKPFDLLASLDEAKQLS